MTNLITLIILAIFIIGLFTFYQLQKRHVKFSNRVFSGLFAGVIFGGILQVVLGVGHQSLTTSLEWIQIVGSGYVHLLQMLVMPLVFVSIVGAFVRMKESNKIGKISANVLFVLL